MEKSIAVVGGDLRIVKLIEMLNSDGYKVYTYALENSEELLNLDSKLFDLGDKIKTKISQVNTADINDVMSRKAKLEEVISNEISEMDLGLNIFLITDIINSNSQIIALGSSTDLVEKAFSVKLENNTAFLPGVVSRKKQVIPVLTAAIN